MKNTVVLLLLALLFHSCKNNSGIKNTDVWNNARWIALEQLDDSMKVVPAVHGFGDHLGNKALKRSVVPLFRKDFNVSAKIKQATVNVCGLGQYELYINNNKIGDRFLSPGWTNYEKRILYNTFDITGQLNEGGNAIGAIVGNGFYNVSRERYRKLVVAYGYPKLIFHIQITYENGKVEHIVSGQDCKVTSSPITFSSIYGGEDYDATLEQKDWCSADFDDSGWQQAIVLNDSIENLKPEQDYPLKVMNEFLPARIFTSKTGRTIYDFGQNASGIISIKVQGNRGAKVIIRPDELLNDEDNITQRSGGKPYEFNYTLKGDGIEEWQPRFSYYGFRYADVEIVEPETVDTKTELLEVKMLHTRNSSPSVGSFSCSDTLFNQTYELINWGIKSNMASVATDCPHREKLGWLEQTYLIGPSMHYNFDIHALYSKIVDDMIDSQLDNGLVPDIAPEYVPFAGGFRDSPEWGSASVIIPWQIYKWYGDLEVLKKAFPMMKSYIGYLQGKADNNILSHGLGDWYDLGPKHPGEAQLTPKAVTATTIYYYDLQIVAQTARLLNENEESEKCLALAEKVKDAFQQKFYDPQTGVCSTGSQTSYAMALYTGILPAQDKEKVFGNLVDSIAQNDYALTAGDIGYHFLVRVLSENGRSDILYKMNNRSDRPGYGYQLKKGATSLTESWSALTDVSNNHMMLGHLMEWFYAGLGGIYQDEKSIAYSNIIIAPKPVGGITWVKCKFESPKGTIVSDWKLNEGKFILNLEIPDQSSAKIVIPRNYSDVVYTVTNMNTQKPVDAKIEDGVINLEAGKYEIKSGTSM